MRNQAQIEDPTAKRQVIKPTCRHTGHVKSQKILKFFLSEIGIGYTLQVSAGEVHNCLSGSAESRVCKT